MSSDNVNFEIEQILKRIIQDYGLSEKEASELKLATINYDYEANEGIIITKKDDIIRLFTEEDYEARIKPSNKQIKAITEYIKETEKYYTFHGFFEQTDKVIDEILNENKEKKHKERGR